MSIGVWTGCASDLLLQLLRELLQLLPSASQSLGVISHHQLGSLLDATGEITDIPKCPLPRCGKRGPR